MGETSSDGFEHLRLDDRLVFSLYLKERLMNLV